MKLHNIHPTLWDASVAVIKASQNPSGGYVAAFDYPTYHYVWMRDGSFIAEAARVIGDLDSAMSFHEFAASTVLDLAASSDPDRLRLPARVQPDGTLDTTNWPNHQIDGYGLWLWALSRAAATHALSSSTLRAAEIVARYLASHWANPCHDPWEEDGRSRPTATLLAVLAGLQAAKEILGAGVWDSACQDAWRDLKQLGCIDDHFTKDLGNPTEVDAATLWAIAPLAVVAADDPLTVGTLNAIETTLGAPGVHRHPRDVYYGGGAWPVLAGFWGLGQLRLGNRSKAELALRWIELCADAKGNLPEQIPENLLAPEFLEIWQRDRGLIATPLVWSHAVYLLLAHSLFGDGPDARC